jgi:hypothetical protein
MELSDPGLTSVFYWWVKEDHLVLYPDFVHNGLHDKMALQSL